MLRISWECSSCGANGILSTEEEIESMCGACPSCYRHKGDIEYHCDMNIEEFLTELENMSANKMAAQNMAIQECARLLRDSR